MIYNVSLRKQTTHKHQNLLPFSIQTMQQQGLKSVFFIANVSAINVTLWSHGLGEPELGGDSVKKRVLVCFMKIFSGRLPDVEV
jgi:hypothetical protein